MLRFGIFEADLRTRELRKGGTKIKLQEQLCQEDANSVMLCER